MSPYSPAFLILALEGVVVLGILSGTLLYIGIRKNRSDRAGASRLVGRIKKDEETRRSKLTAIFKGYHGLEGEELGRLVEEFVSREKAFYKTVIALYLDRDSSKLAKFSESLEEVIGPCLELAARKPAAAEGADVQELREQNDVLERELQSTRRVMETLMSEYNAAFNKDGTAKGSGEGTEDEAGEESGEKPPAGSRVELEDEAAGSKPAGPVSKLLDASTQEEDATEPAEPAPGATPTEGSSAGDHPEAGQDREITDKDIDRIMEAIGEGEEEPPEPAKRKQA